MLECIALIGWALLRSVLGQVIMNSLRSTNHEFHNQFINGGDPLAFDPDIYCISRSYAKTMRISQAFIANCGNFNCATVRSSYRDPERGEVGDTVDVRYIQYLPSTEIHMRVVTCNHVRLLCLSASRLDTSYRSVTTFRNEGHLS